ncbi:MAG TPA: hypothetical protein VNO30_50090 [Kofleriaceae bacterium]|nr:hypothetical protein [Kofleriaceae bacterium]
MRRIAKTCGVAGALAAACALAAGCGEVRGAPADASTPDGAGPDAALSWSAFVPVAINYAEQVRVPVPSGDGLTLYFLAQLSGTDLFDIYSASRARTSDGFGVATALLNVNVTGEQARYPEVSEDGLELYYSKGDMGAIMVATRSNTSSAFGAPAQVANGVAGNFPSISGDKLALYYVAQAASGSINGQIMRISRATLGDAWSAPSPVTVTGAVQIYSAIDISRDELALLRAPTLSPLGVNVLISRRSSKTASFDATEIAQTADVSGVPFSSARWSARDTEIWIGRAMNQVERPFVSQLR